MSNDNPLDIDIDLSDVSTTIPLIADNTRVKVRLNNISKGERDGNVIVKWDMTLSEPAPTEDGTTVGPGFHIFTNFDMSQDWLKRRWPASSTASLARVTVATRRASLNAPASTRRRCQPDRRGSIAKVVIQRSKKTDFVGNEVVSVTHLNDQH
jgi:hypothetical protein